MTVSEKDDQLEEFQRATKMQASWLKKDAECVSLKAENELLHKNVQHWMEESFKWHKRSMDERFQISKNKEAQEIMRRALLEIWRGLGNERHYVSLANEALMKADRIMREMIQFLENKDA